MTLDKGLVGRDKVIGHNWRNTRRFGLVCETTYIHVIIGRCRLIDPRKFGNMFLLRPVGIVRAVLEGILPCCVLVEGRDRMLRGGPSQKLLIRL